ncbi:MBL fold metallo-hydrolase [Chryseobacterium sp. 8AT]|uniref:MBL fold metallo-hydrolase n=1 Tax=Chryseobacterium sp. 8AT TaxID=2653134 RepID=UPI0012EEEC7B|nr:MBL fold metallo-hydrolase [Chryseobacterium sp. 8AT]VXC57596.1 conserved hypothetical protein [Chryseobacterium sp. 8AT]
MKRMIYIDFKFRAVGQGAFYTGIFKHQNGNQFSFVYDCGSKSTRRYIDQEILNFVGENNNKKIDVLFISHFHADHINKINELLNKTAGAKCAILPYLTPEELLLAYIDVRKSGGDPDTLSFIQNPTGFLLERSVDEIIYIHPSDEDESNEDNNSNINDPDPERLLSENFNFKISNGLKPNTKRDEGNPKVSHYYDVGIFSIVDFWEFKFFNKHRDVTTLKDFIFDVKLLSGINDLNFNEIADFITTNPATFDSSFNTIYSKNFGYGQLINDTSLVVYHGPLVNFDQYVTWIHEWWPYRIIDKKGTLLTGDIKFDQDCLDQLTNKWINVKYFENISVFQVPHHGANHYIESSIVNFYNNVDFWIVNYGLGNTYKHPRQEVVDMIEFNKFKGEIFGNTQVNAFNYSCSL